MSGIILEKLKKMERSHQDLAGQLKMIKKDSLIAFLKMASVMAMLEWSVRMGLIIWLIFKMAKKKAKKLVSMKMEINILKLIGKMAK